MTRNLIVLGCAGLFALGLSVGSFAGLGDPDCDIDGILDPFDNCLFVPNGPVGGTCSANEDATVPGLDPDGYGTACDTDYNNTGAMDAADFSKCLANFLVLAADAETDHNCTGASDAADFSQCLGDFLILAAPGPSGKACQGMVPCP